MEGWIKIHRGIKDHWIWKSDHRFKWWLDILLTVNHADSKILIKGKLIECKRGQSVRSLETWARDWNVTKGTVRDFFKLLESDQMLYTESLQVTTRITVCKYDDYQTELHAEKTQKKRKSNAEETDGIPKQECKEGKEVKSFNFYAEEVKKAKQFTDSMSTAYVSLCNHVCKKDKEGLWLLPYVLKIETQISLDDFSKLYKQASGKLESITTKIDSIQNNKDYHNKYTNLYLTINTWFNRDNK